MYFRVQCSEITIPKGLNSSVFATLESWFSDYTKFSTEIKFRVYRGSQTSSNLRYKGYFSANDIKFNDDGGQISVTPKEDDIYRRILKKINEEYYLGDYDADADMEIKFQEDERSGIDYSAAWSNISFSSGILYADRNTSYPDPAYASLTPEIDVESGETIYIKYNGSINSGGSPSIGLFNDTTLKSDTKTFQDGISQTAILTVSSSGTVYPGIKVEPYTPTDIEWEITEFYIRRRANTGGIILEEAIKNIITLSSGLDLDFTDSDILSTFLWNDSLPSVKPPTIDTYITSYPTRNYVNQVAETNRLNDLVLAKPWSEIYRDWGDPKVDTSLSWIFNMLKANLNAYWYIDSDDNFRIEHRYFFEDKISTIDLTTLDDGIHLKGAGSYESDKSGITYREKWEELYVNGFEFVGYPIIYGFAETSDGEIKEYERYVLSDFEYMYEHGHDEEIFDETEFLMLCQCYTDSGYYVVQYEIGETMGSSEINGHIALANLHKHYFQHGRMFRTGTMNDSPETFDSWKRIKKQTVRFPYTTDFDPLWTQIKTDEGTGWIEWMERDLDSDFITAKICLT